MTYRRILVGLMALVMFGVAPARQDSDQAVRLMREVVSANSKLSYQGIRRVKWGERQHIEHIVRSGEKIRIEYTGNGDYEGMVVVDDGTFRWQFDPKKNIVFKGPSWPDDRFATIVGLVGKENVRFELASGGNVAGFQTRLVTASADDKVLHRLWVDPVTKCVLKRESTTREGTVVFVFENLSILSTVSSETFKFSHPGVQVVTPEDTLKKSSDESGLPGFRLEPDTGYRLARAWARKDREGQFSLSTQYIKGREFLFLSVSTRAFEPRRSREPSRGASYKWTVGRYYFMLAGSTSESRLKELSRRVRS